LAEIMHVVGAGEQLVGVSAWSDFPREVLELPEVGDAFTVDQEQLSLLRPDLLLVWDSGMPSHTVDELRKLGYRVESITTRSLDDVVVAIRRIGELTGRQATAEQAATRFTDAFDALRDEYREASAIDVFFQISARPLYTVNREHFISEIITICGGRNIFDDLEGFAPSVDVEAVVSRDPEPVTTTRFGGQLGLPGTRPRAAQPGGGAMKVREPRASDYATVKAMLADAGLPTEDFVPEHLAFVAEENGEVVAAIGFEALGEVGLMRSLVVADGIRFQGLGRKLVDTLETRAQAQGVSEIWLLTLGVDAYFLGLGYQPRNRSEAPTSLRRTAEFSELCPDSATLMSKKLC
jgi:N-acetylglutamate synthase-like GNAT family acetyltransferase